jgi:hypothetical protein
LIGSTEDEVSALDVGLHLGEAELLSEGAQLCHDDFGARSDIDAAQQRHELVH